MYEGYDEASSLKFQCIEYEYARKPIRLFNTTVDLISIGDVFVKLGFKQSKNTKQFILIPLHRVLSINFIEENL